MTFISQANRSKNLRESSFLDVCFIIEYLYGISTNTDEYINSVISIDKASIRAPKVKREWVGKWIKT